MLVHATAVAIEGRAVLITGASGRGKSDLALRLIDRGAQLIADDQVDVDAALHAAPPPVLAGLIEVRGLGIVAMPFVAGIAVALVVDLDAVVERMPVAPVRMLHGIAVPCIALAAFEASSPLKVERALKQVVAAIETRA